MDSYEAGFLGPNTPPPNNVTIEGEKSLSSEDTSHWLVTGWLYELPFGRGKRFDSGISPALDKVLGGWEVSGVLTFSVGLPLGDLGVTPDRSGSYSDAFGGFVARLRPDLLREPCLSHGRPRGERILRYVDENAFGFPEPFKFGSAPRTLPRCRGDGWKNFDVSITKNIPIRESVRTEFRAEFFNLFNRPQLKHPTMIVGSGSFGQITAQENQPRIIQFALRVHF